MPSVASRAVLDDLLEVRPVDLRLVPAAVVGWVAAWLGTMADRAAVLTTTTAGLALTCALLGRRAGRHQHGGQVLLCLAAATGILACCAALAAQRTGGPVPGWVQQRAVGTATGVVAEDPRPLPSGRFAGPPRWAVTVRDAALSARGGHSPASGPVTVIGAVGPPLSAGSRIQVSGRLLPTRGRSAEVAMLVATQPPLVTPGTWPWRAADSIRDGLRRASTGVGPDADGLLPALVVGDVSRLPPDLREAMKATGLSHLTAVSGTNLTIVAGGAVWLGVALGARRGVRVVIAALAVVGFVVLARPQPSVLRAGVMAAVALAGLVRGRSGRGLPALAGCVLVLLAVDPWLCRSFGFALSVCATSGLVLLAPPLARRWSRRLPVWLATALAVPVAAELFTAPVAALLRPSVSLVSVPANLLTGPAVAPATVLGVLAALASTVSDGLARLVARPGLLATAWVARVARTSAEVPHAAVPLPDRSTLGTVLAAVLLAALAAAVLWTRRPGALVLLAMLVAVGWLGAGALPSVPVPQLPGRPGWPPAGWRMVQCAVGQGDALVINSGPGRAVLVDTGPDPGLLDGCLRRLGVQRLDLVVVTHHHSDHAAGLAGALRGRRVGQLLVSPLARPAAAAEQVRREAGAAGVAATPAWAGLHGAGGGSGAARVDWQVLWPVTSGTPGELFSVAEDGDRSIEDSAANDASVVLLVQVAGLRLLALGDLEPAAQRELARRGGLPDRVDVVKVSHHGSPRQEPELYSRLGPRVALIGVGPNTYGHPAPQTLRMLAGLGAVVLRTDQMGDVALVSDHSGLAARTRRR